MRIFVDHDQDVWIEDENTGLFHCADAVETEADLRAEWGGVEWKPAPTDHTAAIAEAAREYVRTRRAHLDHGPLLSARKAAHDALIAAVDAERAEREPGCTCVRCAPNYHLMRGCPTCGNKRCPKVADHDNRCTGSNEPGQIPEREARGQA